MEASHRITHKNTLKEKETEDKRLQTECQRNWKDDALS